MSIFKKGDKVYHYEYGNGQVIEIDTLHLLILWANFKRWMSIQHAENCLSFTPYDLIHGGFSQERPKPEIEKGQIVYYKVKCEGVWKIGKLHSEEDNAVYVYYGDGLYQIWKSTHDYSLENPLI